MKNKQKEIKMAATLKAQGGGSSTLPPHVSKKRKYTSNVQSSGKGASSFSTHPEARDIAVDAPRHGEHKIDPLGDSGLHNMMRFPDVDFSSIQIKLSAPITPAVEPIPNNEETEEEVLVNNRPGGVADDPMNPQEQTDNPLVDP
nr:hypothetical protein CFP56_57406 [Quercus suber]